MPDYLPVEAQAVWRENLTYVVACGVCDADANLFARYCFLEAHFRDRCRAGEMPRAAVVAEPRRLSELLCIGGPRSRTGDPRPPADNPFSRNGRPTPTKH